MAAAEPQASSGKQDLTGSNVGRFAIRALLGRGGMGEVYRADDTRLKRPVALKRVSRKLGDDPRLRRRILKEAERSSALSSPHIAAIYDVVEEQGEVFLVMEYVEGASLRQRLRATGRIPTPEFLNLAMQCADALAAAQKKGIVHRDIKPDNILVTPDGQVKILDFGLARQHAPDSDSDITVSAESLEWSIAGTPGYIAPEVLCGGEADHRSDVFALGVTYYEMLTARHPFSAESKTAIAARTLQATPQPVHELAQAVPAELEQIIAKMLAKQPENRYSLASDLLADLQVVQSGRPSSVRFPPAPRPRGTRYLIGSAAAVVLLLLGFLIAPVVRQQWNRRFTGAPLPQKKNLAVLPFEVLGEDPGARAFAQGLAETLNAQLAHLSDNYPVQVIPPSEMRAQHVSSVEQARIGLGANLVLEGSLERSGTRMRISYHLVDSRTRQQLRGDTVTAPAADPFAVEDHVVQSVLRSLDLELGSKDRQALAAYGTSEPAAYDYYLRGRGYLMEYQKQENVDSAIEVFKRALERDPNYALAYAGLGESYWRKFQATHAGEWVTRALEACQKAAGESEGAICLGYLHNETGKYEQAVSEFQRGLEADRTSDDAYRGLAYAYEHLGKTAEAEQTHRRAIAVRPQYWAGYNWLGAFLFRHGRFPEAVEMFQQVTALAPDSFRGYMNLGGAYTALGRFDEALPALEKSVSLRPSAAAYSNLGLVYFYLRRFGDAARAQEQALKLDDHDYLMWGNLAESYYWSPGEREKAAAAYRRALVLAEERLKINPREAAALGQVALCNAMLGNAAAAEQSLQRALDLAPADPDLQLKGAMIESKFGHPDRATVFLEKALATGASPGVVRNTPNFDELVKSEPLQKLLRAAASPAHN